MNNTDKLNFLVVNNTLLANTTLSSTQKLFISFILGWQRSDLTCKMTNRNLASHFGMKRGGIRSLLNKLNKYNFFETTQYGHTNKNSIWTSGHEMKVDEVKLMDFLQADKVEQNFPEYKSIIKNMSKTERDDFANEMADDLESLTNKIKSIIEKDENNNVPEHEPTPTNQLSCNANKAILDHMGDTIFVTEKLFEELAKNESEDEVQNEIDKSIDDYQTVTQYRDDELVDIEEILTNLNFKQSDITHFTQRFRSNKVIFEDFASYFFGLILAQEREKHYSGVKISKEQEERFKRILIA